MKLKTITAFFAIIWAVSTTVSAQKVSIYSTTSTERWVEKKQTLDKNPAGQADICVYPDSLLQNVVGFGGTFNELCFGPDFDLDSADFVGLSAFSVREPNCTGFHDR